jgi:hypothetical protein
MVALEMRAPLTAQNGAQRYLFDFDEPKSDRFLKIWSSGYSRYAGKAYTSDHGTQTDELSHLIFNKSDFRLVEAFPNSHVPHNTEFYSPLVRTARIRSKIRAREWGVLFGCHAHTPVNEKRGRLGVRVTLPVRRIEIERADQDGVPAGAALQDVLAISHPIKDPTQQNDEIQSKQVPLVRMDFAEGLVQSNMYNSAFQYADKNGKPSVGGLTVSDPDIVTEDATNRTVKRCLGVVRSPQGLIPRAPEVTRTAVLTKAADPEGSGGYLGTDAMLPADGNAEYGKVYRFEADGAKANQYKSLSDAAVKDVDQRIADQKIKEELWLVPYLRVNSDVTGADEGGAIKVLRDLSEQVTENAYEWMKDRDFLLESSIVSGISDLDLEFFYEHALTDYAYGELMLGFRVPTAEAANTAVGPYAAQLGNNKHWEVKLGGALSWKPLNVLNIHVDGHYAFVLPHEEKVRATYKGSKIKNVGPLVDASVNWNYFVGRVDATVFHLKNKGLSNMIGYEIYWKDRDTVIFPANYYKTWLGQKFGSDGHPQENLSPLDPALLTSNTERIAHRCRLETSMRMTDQCELYFGIGYTFAGKNMPRELDGSFGMMVSF